MSSCVIEEINENAPPNAPGDGAPGGLDAALQQALRAHKQSARAVLAAVFESLDRHTDFFAHPEVSKELARLLRDVKAKSLKAKAAEKPKVAPAPPAPAPAAPGASPGSLGAASAPTAAAPLTATPSEGHRPGSSTAAAGPAAGAAPEQSKEDAEEEERKKHLLKPNAGNGADLGAYSWTQTLGELTLTVPVPQGTRGRDCQVAVTKTHITVGLKGQAPVITGELAQEVKVDSLLWNVDSKTLEVTLQKRDGMSWWKSVVKGAKEIDTQKVEPENSKLSDLDGDTRATVEKMMWDQRQKQLGLPTSEQAQQQEMLQKFMKAHPEMDFSQAKFG